MLWTTSSCNSIYVKSNETKLDSVNFSGKDISWDAVFLQSSWMINANGISLVVVFRSGSRTHMLNFKALRNSQEPDIFWIKIFTMSTVHPPVPS